MFHRSFDKNGKESYIIDGNKVSAKVYIDRVRTFRIQVDNLCMFLPQDRVQDFTKLNPQELLHNTQISVCSDDINEAFASLKKKREQQKSAAKQNAEIQVQLTDNVNRNEQLHQMIENNRTKEKLMVQRDLYQKKKVWLEYEVLKTKFDEVSTDMKKFAEVLTNKRNELKPLERKQQEISGAKTKLKNDIGLYTNQQSRVTSEIDQMVREAQKINIEIRQTKQEIQNIIQSSRDHEKDVDDLKLKIRLDRNEYEKAQQELHEDENVETLMKEYDKVLAKFKNKIDEVFQHHETLNFKLDEQVIPGIRACERKIEFMSDTYRRRFQTLRNNFDDAYKASEWLKNNRDQFNGQIFNPILTEIAVTDKRYAKYIENCVSNRDLETFLCTDKEDMTKLIRILRNDMKLKINVGYTEPAEDIQFGPSRDIAEFPQQYGIYAYLLDMIEGPAPVLNYLCKLYSLHNIVVGDDRIEKFASQLPNDIRVFFSTNSRFNAVVSRYTGMKSVQSNEIIQRNILDVGIDHDEMNLEQQKLCKFKDMGEKIKAERLQAQNRMKELEAEREVVRVKKSEIANRIRAVNLMGQTLNRKEKELENLMKQKIDIPQERLKIKQKNDKLVKKLMQSINEICVHMVKHKDCTVKRELAKKKLRVFDDNTGNVDQKIDNLKRHIREIEYAFDNAKRDCVNCENRMTTKRREALQLTDNIDKSDPSFPYKKKFEKIPNTIGELVEKIEEMQGRIECIRGVDPAIIEEYERRKITIEQLRESLNNEQERALALEDELKKLHQIWYPEITHVVNTINENFSNFFSKMGFVGEVELTCKEERDYADYGIGIRVQYRDNEKLQALNRHVQSGGERAVAIAVYTLSLQHLTMVPFRCVDEINQGMDPNNERKIFQMLVDITCKAGQSQYFFVTPKLLSDLPYDDLMTITVVHNGKNIADPYVFESDDENADETAMDVE